MKCAHLTDTSHDESQTKHFCYPSSLPLSLLQWYHQLIHFTTSTDDASSIHNRALSVVLRISIRSHHSYSIGFWPALLLRYVLLSIAIVINTVLYLKNQLVAALLDPIHMHYAMHLKVVGGQIVIIRNKRRNNKSVAL